MASSEYRQSVYRQSNGSVCCCLRGDSASGMSRHRTEPLKILLILCVLAKGSICQMLIDHKENEYQI